MIAKAIGFDIDKNGCHICNNRGVDSHGYPVTASNKKITTVARWLMDARPGEQVLHKCDNRMCINPEHLYIGTHYQNIMDRVARNRGFRPVGEKNPNVKLDNNKVGEIRRIGRRKSEYAIAKEFNISQQSVSNILLNKSWKHV